MEGALSSPAKTDLLIALCFGLVDMRVRNYHQKTSLAEAGECRKTPCPAAVTGSGWLAGRERDFMKVVILAGGRGTRLSEETTVKPKPMVEIGGHPIV